MSDQIRVVVIDDEQLVAEGLARLLGDEDDIEVVGVVGWVADTADVVRATEPDVVIVDHRLPDGDGVAATTAVHDVDPDVAVLMLTRLTDEQLLLAALDAGCAGLLTKDNAVGELVSAVRVVHGGEPYLPAPILHRLLPRLRASYRGMANAVSAREREVLELMADGLSNPAIADRLELSIHTIRNPVQSILNKLGAHSKLEAVSIAVREGVIDYPSAS